MQNNEIKEVFGKKVIYVLYDKNGNKITSDYNISENTYTIFWYDTKLKNYLLLLEYLKEKRQIIAKYEVILIVNKQHFLDNIEAIKS